MKIWTTYYQRTQYLPKEYKQFGISRSVPEFYEGARLFELAPTRELFSIGKSSTDKTTYIEGYRTKVLGKLDPHKIARAVGHNAVLVCYEANDKFCHRHLVSEWLRYHGYDVSEWIFNE